ncbi:WYL domain-containing protein [Streptomyces sp. PRh5]|uniref:WYL domain-containing protein n=1 Tax=Streptomyces sp. PRh5 TaxID=1158056 RepID=UPI0004B1FF2E|nr:WYL domain-containing protein [Streptomyces sp. PRh5]
MDSTAVSVGDDGWVGAVIPAEGTDHACGELLRLGTDIEVLAPAGLRQAMTATVGALNVTLMEYRRGRISQEYRRCRHLTRSWPVAAGAEVSLRCR